MEIEHERQLAIIESKLAEQKQSGMQSIQAAVNEQKLKCIETIKLLQQKVQTLEHGSNQNNLDMKTPPHNSLNNSSMLNQSMMNQSLINIFDKFEKLLQLQNLTLQQSATSLKEHYISNAKTYDGKDPKEFNQWLGSVSWLSRISGKDLLEVAMAISTGLLHRHISELMALGINWDIIKSKIQEGFSEFGSPVVAQNKLTTLTQKTMAMHEYISEFTSIIEYAYNIKLTEKGSHSK